MNTPIDMKQFQCGQPQTMSLCRCNKCQKVFFLLPSMITQCPYCNNNPIPVNNNNNNVKKEKTNDELINILFAKIKKLEKEIKELKEKPNKPYKIFV